MREMRSTRARAKHTAIGETSCKFGRRPAQAMHKVEIRPDIWMAYEDHWFGPPWTTPEAVVMVHGNSESSRAWTCWVPHLAGKYRVLRPDLPGFGASTEPRDY